MSESEQVPGQMELADVLPDFSRDWHRSEVEMCADHVREAARRLDDRETDLAVAMARAAHHDQIGIQDLAVWSGLRAVEVRRRIVRIGRWVLRRG